MKQTDNRQKQNVIARAQKAHLAGKNPLAEKGKEHHAATGPKEEGVEAADVPGTVTRNEPKVGRNEPCPCGSGKKFKKCCLK